MDRWGTQKKMVSTTNTDWHPRKKLAAFYAKPNPCLEKVDTSKSLDLHGLLDVLPVSTYIVPCVWAPVSRLAWHLTTRKRMLNIKISTQLFDSSYGRHQLLVTYSKTCSNDGIFLVLCFVFLLLVLFRVYLTHPRQAAAVDLHWRLLPNSVVVLLDDLLIPEPKGPPIGRVWAAQVAGGAPKKRTKFHDISP